MLLGQFVEARDAEPDPGHPEGILVIAEAADAVLDVGFLQKDCVPMLAAAAALVGEPGGDVGLGVGLQVVLAVGVGEILVEGLGARDEAGLEERRLGLDLAVSLGEHLVQGAGGVTDLQLQVPKRVEDAVGEVFLEPGQFRGFLHLGIEEHHVHVAQRAEFGPAIAAERDQADRHRRFAVLQAPAGEGGGKKGNEQTVHATGQGLANLAAGFTRLVAIADALPLGLKIGPAGGQPHSGRGLTGEDWLVEHGRGGAHGHGGVLHQQCNSHWESWKYAFHGVAV